MAEAVVRFGREICGDLDVAERREWLVTNGIGGYASGTIAGSLTRCYHGYLVAALTPPLGRTLLLSRLEDTVTCGAQTYPLSANRWSGGTVGPQGYRFIESFMLEGAIPTWAYACGDALLEKRVWMERGSNTTYVRYAVLRAGAPLQLDCRALVDYRGYHDTTHAYAPHASPLAVAEGFAWTAFAGAATLRVRAAGTACALADEWYYGFALPREAERGLPASDDHLHAGTFTATLAAGEALTFVISTDGAAALDGEDALQRRQSYEAGVLRRFAGVAAEAPPPWIAQLALAADQFVVERKTPQEPDGKTVIAGYHWFGDWGRDTMISLPGLTFAVGDPGSAATILRTFSRYVSEGMLPNDFPDAGTAPAYNTVDATLWYFEAIRAYYAATGDARLPRDLFAVLAGIVDAHVKGTRYGIGLDHADGLLRAGVPGVQLTWMDAKVGDHVITPRIGKPVEVNALWYNALRSMEQFASLANADPTPYRARADRVAASFERFWNPASGYCFDVLDGPDGNDPALRPNQLLVVALHYRPLRGAPGHERAILDACARELLVSYGLRSLSPHDRAYVGTYGGDQAARDGAYHQGTVWAWLLGPFVSAHLNVHGDPALARAFLAPLEDHVRDYGLGTIAEIFDGDPPLRPRGCIAQAWSVAECLRAYRATYAAPPR